MSKRLHEGLSKRERQIMNVVYQNKHPSVGEVLKKLPQPPSYSAVRATMNKLVEKGFLTTKKEGKKYLYLPTIPNRRAGHSAIQHLLHTYFDNSVGDAVAALIKSHGYRISDSEYRDLIEMLEETRKEE